MIQYKAKKQGFGVGSALTTNIISENIPVK